MRARSCVKIETAAPGPAESHVDAPIYHPSISDDLPRSLAVAPLHAAPHAPGADIWAATVAAIWPWRRGGYRGWSVASGEALGYAATTVRRWLIGGSRGVSHAASLRIIALLETRIAVLAELLVHWRRYAADRAVIEAQTTPGFKFRSFSATERAGWRSKPRAPRTPRT
jgi:hypothetical protein